MAVVGQGRKTAATSKNALPMLDCCCRPGGAGAVRGDPCNPH